VPGKDINGAHDRAPRLVSDESGLGGNLPGSGPAPASAHGRVGERRGCLGHAATLRFLSPLIEPDMQISPIRLSDKTSRLRPRLVVAKPGQAYEPEVPVKVRGWIGPAPASPDFVLEPQPPA
jgi:hypothetical protein